MKNNTLQTFKKITKKGSKTYFNSTLFFPKKIRDDVFTLYSFVRTADDYVDKIPQNKTEFRNFKHDFYIAYKNDNSKNIIIHEFVKLAKRKGIEKKWIDAFLDAMNADLSKQKYLTIQETNKYMYGSAEVVGLMMSKILELPKKSYPYAKLLGRSMQYINFLRDIKEDNSLKRQYIPQHFLEQNNLFSLDKKSVFQNKESFIKLIRHEIKRYEEWQKKAEKGYAYIPYRYLIPIKTASDMYNWTAKEIYKNPLAVFDHKIKPSKSRIYFTILKNSILILLWKI